MPEPDVSGSEHEALWRDLLMGTAGVIRRRRGFHRRLPWAPRCKMCARPFGGPIGFVMRLQGKGPWPKNPTYCTGCFASLQARRGGAEIPCSVLFADVRGSTGLAEQMAPSRFRNLLARFYSEATRVLIDHDGIVDKFMGDEVMALFIPALAFDAHAARAIEAARDLLAATGHGAGREPWIPVGVGIATGTAFVGSVGTGDATELTALGDIVNVGARLASIARSGEILVTGEGAAEAATGPGVERRVVEIRGRTERVEVAVLSATR